MPGYGKMALKLDHGVTGGNMNTSRSRLDLQETLELEGDHLAPITRDPVTRGFGQDTRGRRLAELGAGIGLTTTRGQDVVQLSDSPTPVLTTI